MIYKANITKYFKNYRLDIFFILLLTLSLPLFFYKLGQSSLVSWDEAWYAVVARNIFKSGDIFNLTYQNKPFLDHPPVGFWSMAISFSLFGVSEFSARLPSAIFGFLTLILVYLLGKKLFNRVVGFCSALSLSSAFWFIYRARSGNLDTALTLFFILTIYLGVLASENKKYLILFLISLALLLQTKTGIPLVILPALMIVFWNTKIYKKKDLIYPGLIFLLVGGSYFLYQILTKSDFLERYLYIGVGLPGVHLKSSYLDNIKIVKEFLHSGIGKWFWPGVMSLLIGFLTLQKRFLILSIFCLSFFAPFIFSPNGRIWHLTPLYPFLILEFFGLFFVMSELIVKNLPLIKGMRIMNYLKFVPLFLIAFYFSLLQIRQEWYQFIDIPRYISDEQILSTEASKYPQRLFIDDDYIPTAVFYSQKNDVVKIFRNDLEKNFKIKDQFLLITNDWRLEQSTLDKSKYRIIKKDRDKVLILKI